MHWKELRKDESIFEYLPVIWAKEQSLPKWFRDASKTWTADEGSLHRFVESCSEVWGMFDGEELMFLIYFEGDMIRPEIHLSVLNMPSTTVFVAKCIELRNQKLHEGTKRIRCWLLTRNHALCRLMEAVGFERTGLKLIKEKPRPLSTVGDGSNGTLVTAIDK